MVRAELKELHYIAAIANLTSIHERGILSRDRARAVARVDVSSPIIQDRRRGKQVPDVRRRTPRRLHEYANLYICGRNPMLYVKRDIHVGLAVLRIDTRALDIPGVVVSDGNAASDYSRFHEVDAGLAAIDQAITFGGDPRHPNRYEFYDRKRRMCAEVLVPGAVPPEHIVGAYVSCQEAADHCAALAVPWPVTIDPGFFFNP
jgi:ssDNA thymidine ADP-ribosyltransferase, DarT